MLRPSTFGFKGSLDDRSFNKKPTGITTSNRSYFGKDGSSVSSNLIKNASSQSVAKRKIDAIIAFKKEPIDSEMSSPIRATPLVRSSRVTTLPTPTISAPSSSAWGEIVTVTAPARKNTPRCELCQSKKQHCLTTELEYLRCDACKSNGMRCSLSSQTTRKLAKHSRGASISANEDEESEYEEPPSKRTRQATRAKDAEEVSAEPKNDPVGDMLRARQYFFDVLDSSKAQMGGPQAEIFKELYMAAKMWQAEKDFLLS